MSLSRYFLDIEDRVPVSAFAVLERGAVVNGDQAAVNTVTVHEGHDFAGSDKFIYALARDNIRIDRIFTVSSVTATTVVFSGATFTFPDKAYLINLGVDTGGVVQNDGTYSKLEYDAAAITVYKDPAGDAAWTDSQVPVDPGGEVGFYGDGRVLWGVALNTGGLGIRIYPDVGSAAASAARGTGLPGAPTPGQLFILDGGSGVGDEIYAYVKFSDDTFNWLFVNGAS